MEEYNAMQPPDPDEWLALDESQRRAPVVKYHRDQLEEVEHERLHATIHVIVETQLAYGIGHVTAAFERLQREGLNRHDAIHAIGAVLVDYSYEIVNDQERPEAQVEEEYARRLRALSAERWRGGDW